ncbi:MAG TPA: PAS domain S-box protein [Terriglobales bacterium]|nr:PAS domain S-box protein [Terriglobales bacterium]
MGRNPNPPNLVTAVHTVEKTEVAEPAGAISAAPPLSSSPSSSGVLELSTPQQSVEELRELLENANDMIYTQDLEANFTWVNRAATKTTGYSFEESMKMNMVDIVAPEYHGLADAMRRRRLETGANNPPYEVEIITKDGRRIPVEVSTRFIYREGKPVGVQGSARDISERKRAEEAMAESEQRFRALVQNSSDIISILDKNYNFRYLTPANQRHTGYTPDEKFGRNWLEFIHPEDVEKARKALDDLRNSAAEEAVISYRTRHKDGSWRHFETNVQNALNVSAIAGIVLNSRDITERRLSEEALHQYEQRLALHAQQTILGVIEFDRDFRIKEWNPAAESIFGYTRSEAVGQPVDLITPPAAREHVDRVWRKTMTQKRPTSSTNENCTHAGRIIHCEWSATPVIDAEGNVMGVIALVQDVSERRQAEDALRISEERYRLLFERNLAGVFWASFDCEFVDCNESFAKMFGYRSRTEVLSLNGRVLYHSPQEHDVLMARLKRERVFNNIELGLRRKDGSPIWVLANMAIVEEGTGGNLIQGTVIDITERKFAEEGLRNAEGKYRSIFENAAEGIFQTSLDGRWLIVNPKMAQIFGYASPEELTRELDVHRNYYVRPERRREFVHKIDREGFITGFESEVYCKDRTTIWVSENVRSVRNARGNLVGFEGTVQDITERRRAEATLLENERRLRRQNEILRELSQRKAIDRGDLTEALQEITEAAAEVLEVERTTVWLFNQDRSALRCEDEFVRSSKEHQNGREFLAHYAPKYFAAIAEERAINTDDAAADPRTQEFYSLHLIEDNISSLMEAPIRAGGKMLGVFSAAHAGNKRSWTLDEENFAGSMADLVSLALEASERKHAEEALRESESKFRAVAETAASAIYIHQGTSFLFCNRGSEVISGYTRDEILKLDPWALVHPEDREYVRQRFTDRQRGLPTPTRYEYRIVTKLGETRWIDFSGSLISFEGQVALLCTAFDITERKKGEQLQAALYRIAEKTNSARDLDELFAAIHGILSELVYARNFYIALLDDRRQILTFPYFVDEINPPPPPHKPSKGLTEYVMRTGQPYLNSIAQERELARRGEVEQVGAPSVDWLGVPLKTGDNVFGVLALQSYSQEKRFGEREKEILTFVSQHIATAVRRKRDEEALRQSEARYRSQVQSAVYGIYRSNLQDYFVDVNPALVAMLGYDSVDEVLVLKLSTEVYSDPSERAALLQEHRFSERISGVDVRWKRKDSKVIQVRLSGRGLCNENGEVESFEMIAEDVTERRALEEQLRQSQKMEAVGRLAGGVAHDFNNLLTVIKGYSELMLDQVKEGDPLRDEVEEVKKAADRAAALTRQLLAFSRKQVLAPKVLDLNQIVTTMERLLRRLLGEDVHLHTQLAADLGRVKADPGQTEQVVMNLAVNARDAMPIGGKLTISTANAVVHDEGRSEHTIPPGAYVVLNVSDTGIGMDADTRTRIFEPFFTTKEQGKGTGLGLSTVYGIVKQSGGYISVNSEPGMGAAFEIYFPRVDEAVDSSSDIAPGQNRRGFETILLVEDEDGVRTLTRQILQKHGYTVLETSHGGEALLACENHKHPIHLLLTDVVLSQMSGRELAQRLSQLRPEMKVLYMSGYSEDAIVQHGVLDSGTSFLQKPFNTEALIAQVRAVLDAPRAKALVQ